MNKVSGTITISWLKSEYEVISFCHGLTAKWRKTDETDGGLRR